MSLAATGCCCLPVYSSAEPPPNPENAVSATRPLQAGETLWGRLRDWAAGSQLPCRNGEAGCPASVRSMYAFRKTGLLITLAIPWRLAWRLHQQSETHGLCMAQAASAGDGSKRASAAGRARRPAQQPKEMSCCRRAHFDSADLMWAQYQLRRTEVVEARSELATAQQQVGPEPRLLYLKEPGLLSFSEAWLGLEHSLAPVAASAS